MKTIILVGIPGSGKSSILQETMNQVPSIRVINYGDKMLEIASSEGLTRDMLRKMPVADQQKIGVKAAKKITREGGDITIVDTHALIRTDAGFCPGLPYKVLEILEPKACAWIECPPALIIERRSKDRSRTRDEESEEELALHQELTRAYLSACSMATGAILCRIVNDSPSITQNAFPLIELIQNLF
jgi:adenylate kinase